MIFSMFTSRKFNLTFKDSIKRWVDKHLKLKMKNENKRWKFKTEKIWNEVFHLPLIINGSSKTMTNQHKHRIQLFWLWLLGRNVLIVKLIIDNNTTNPKLITKNTNLKWEWWFKLSFALL